MDLDLLAKIPMLLLAAYLTAMSAIFLIFLGIVKKKQGLLQDIRRIAVVLHAELDKKIAVYRQYKHECYLKKTALENVQQIVTQAITMSQCMAEQVPNTYTPDQIRQHMFLDYDPDTMSAAFLSVSQQEPGEVLATALMTVLYGKEPGSKQGIDDFFVRVYGPDNKLQLAYVRSTNNMTSEAGFKASEWLSLMVVFEQFAKPAKTTNSSKEYCGEPKPTMNS